MHGVSYSWLPLSEPLQQYIHIHVLNSLIYKTVQKSLNQALVIFCQCMDKVQYNTELFNKILEMWWFTYTINEFTIQPTHCSTFNNF